MGKEAPDIFISYAHQDEAWVAGLATALQASGRIVFWDRRVPAGSTWRSHIGGALEQARCVVVVWSEHSIVSEYVQEEAGEGKQRRVLVPALRQAVRPPFGFREIHAADLSRWSPGAAAPAFETFLTDLDAILGPAAVAEAGAQHAATAASSGAPPVLEPAKAEESPVSAALTEGENVRPETHAESTKLMPPEATLAGGPAPWSAAVDTGAIPPPPAAPDTAPMAAPIAKPSQAAAAEPWPRPDAGTLAALGLIALGALGAGIYALSGPSHEPTVEAEPAVTPPRPAVGPVAPSPAAPSPADAEAALGLSRGDWQAVQLGLSSQGFDAGAAEGVAGPKTRQALAAWQTRSGAAATGYLAAGQADQIRRSSRKETISGTTGDEGRKSPPSLPAPEESGREQGGAKPPSLSGTTGDEGRKSPPSLQAPRESGREQGGAKPPS